MLTRCIGLLAAAAVACGSGDSDRARSVDDARRPIDAALPSHIEIDPGPIDALAFGATTGEILVTAGGATHRYDATGQRAEALDPPAAAVNQVLAWPNPVVTARARGTETVAAAYSGGRIRALVRPASDWTIQVARAVDAGAEVRALAITGDGERVLSASGPQVTLWSMARSRSLRTMRVADGEFAVSRAGNALATVLSGQIVVRHVPGGSVALRVAYADGAAYALSPDGAVLAVAAGDGRIALHATGVAPPEPATAIEPPAHWSEAIRTPAGAVTRDALRKWDVPRTPGAHAAIGDATLRSKSPPYRVTAVEYSVVGSNGVATKLSIDVGDKVQRAARSAGTWRAAALEVSGVRCMKGEAGAICYATAKNTGGESIPIEALVRAGDRELAHGAGAAMIDSNATVDIALRAAAPPEAKELTLCVFSLVRTGGVSCADVPVE